jgi:hydroxypyruvate reductase
MHFKNPTDHQRKRAQLLQIYQAALNAVAGDRAVADWLKHHPLQGDWAVLAIGKAAGAMVQGAREALAAHLREVLVITKADHGGTALAGECWVEGGHPVPDARSLAAGKQLLEFLEQLPDERPLLVLLSGGASALVEVLPLGMDAEQLAEVNRYLLGAGLDIDTINRVRRRLSLIKGGRLLPLLHGRPCVQLLIADVPGDDPAVIGSGPLIPSAEQALPDLPEWIADLCRSTPPVVATGQGCESHIIANNGLAREVATQLALEMGLTVYPHEGIYQGTVEEVARACCRELLACPPGLHIWGGEATVCLPGEPGRGGRNQHLALWAAKYRADQDNILLLAAATDGSDGPTSDAGGLVDGQTLARGEAEGFSAELALARANAGTFLEASGDLISTGPTGTNVMDLVIAWKFQD